MAQRNRFLAFVKVGRGNAQGNSVGRKIQAVIICNYYRPQGNVMFSEVSVSHSVQEGVGCPFPPEANPPPEATPSPPFPVTATAVVGTHPTGMHSCIF